MARIMLWLAPLLVLGLVAYAVAKKWSTPRAAAAGPEVRLAVGKLGAGQDYLVALDAAGRVHGWGSVRFEADAAGGGTSIPKAAPSRSTFASLYAGSRATYALTDLGVLWRIGPRQASRFSSSSANMDFSADHYIALFPERLWRKAQETWNVGAGIDYSSKLWFWLDDQLPDVSRSNSPGAYGSPVQLGVERKFADFCLTASRVYAVSEDGGLWRTGDLTEWRKASGRGPAEGEDGSDPEELKRIAAKTEFAKVFCTRASMKVYAIDRQGHLWAFGFNTFGELGDGDDGPRVENVPESKIKQIGNLRWAMIAPGHTSTYGIARDGSLWAWGRGADGELGLGDRDSRNAPALVDGKRTWVAVAATDHSGAALTDQGEIYTWGLNAHGLLGDGAVARERMTPTLVLGETRFGN